MNKIKKISQRLNFGEKLFLLTMFLLLLLAAGCHFLIDDNPIEEFIEDVIEENSGIKIDITGDSLEAP